jgi:hypothetical protein
MRVLLRSLKATYLTVDPRSLGLFRIGLGLVLLSDLLRRYLELDFWYTNAGLLPNHTLLWRPPATHVFSLFFMASSHEEASLGFALCALAYALFTLGYRTRLMQVLVLVGRVSINSRLAVLENGGDMVLNLLCMFTLVLPLGRRFSLDAWLASLRGTEPREAREPVVSIAVLGLILQFSAVYLFNAVSKSGAAWHDGWAVHYALHQDKYVTPLGVWMREHLSGEALRWLTWSVLGTEWVAWVLIATPVLVHYARAIAVVVLPLLHLGFALGLNLGGFSVAMMAFYPLLLTDVHWDWLGRLGVGRALRERLAAPVWLRRAALALHAEPPALSPFRLRARRWGTELGALLLIFAVGTEALNDNASVPRWLRVHEPRWAKVLIEYPRLLQGWRMFAPEPPTEDSMIYVDATTAEGKHVDPYNLVASRQSFPSAGIVPTRMGQSQFFVMYSDRIAMQQYSAYRQAFLEWILAYPKRTGRPQDCLTSFGVYYVTDRTPAPGTHAAPAPGQRTQFMEYAEPANGSCRPLHPPALQQGDLHAESDARQPRRQ